MSLFKRRSIVFVSLSAVTFAVWAGLAATSPQTAQAAPSVMTSIAYFDDAQASHRVGFQVLLQCGGGHGPLVGIRTNHTITEQISCSPRGGEVGCTCENIDPDFCPCVE